MLGAPVTITPPTGDLISLEAAKSFLRVDGSQLDEEVKLARDASIEDLQQYTGLRLLSQTVEVTADCFADLELFRVGPVQTVIGISYIDTVGDQQALPAEGFELHGAHLEQGVRSIATWPAARPGSVIARLLVGYGAAEDVPAKLRHAVFAIMRGKYEERPVDMCSLVGPFRFWI